MIAHAHDSGLDPVPHFSVVPAERTQEGMTLFTTLQAAAASESFLDMMLGTDCYSRAVTELQRDCKLLDQEAKSRLALRLANCQLATQGQRTHPCEAGEPLRRCVERLPDRDNYLYVEFLTHVDGTCLFIQNRDFEKYTESMLNRLSQGAEFAKEQLESMGARTKSIAMDAAAIKAGMEHALAGVLQAYDLQIHAAKAAEKHHQDSFTQFAELSVLQSSAISLADQSRQLSQAAGQAMSEILGQIAMGHQHVTKVLDTIASRAQALEIVQNAAAQAQRDLRENLQALIHDSQGVRAAIETVTEYQRRSDALLIRLLGQSYGLEDAVFYGIGALMAVLSGASQRTRGARLPLFALLGLTVLAERALIERMHLWLDVDATGAVVASIPMPWWVAFTLRVVRIGSQITYTQALDVNIKWAVRRICLALAAAVLVAVVRSYRDYERVNHRLLEAISNEQMRQGELLKVQRELLSARLQELQALWAHPNGRVRERRRSSDGGNEIERLHGGGRRPLARYGSPAYNSDALLVEKTNGARLVMPDGHCEAEALADQGQGIAGLTAMHNASIATHVPDAAPAGPSLAKISGPSLLPPMAGPRAVDTPQRRLQRRQAAADATKNCAKNHGKRARQGAEMPSISEAGDGMRSKRGRG